jgi:hypothetical protein
MAPLNVTIWLYATHGINLTQGYLVRKKFEGKIFKCGYISHFIITKLFLKSDFLLFKLYKLMVPIGKKPPPATTNPV